MKQLYPEISPFHTFYLETDSIHRVYVEQSGNPAGFPVLFLHGGPCSGTKPDHRRFFDPERYHIILMDQRGCGLSQPFGELMGNTTQDLMADMERIRLRLRIEQWLLFGGSWGGTLALLYAQQHPDRVSGMVLRGVFLARKIDMDWFLQNGVNRIYPQLWQALSDSVEGQPGETLLQRLYHAVYSGDATVAERAARQWQIWGAQVALGAEYRADNSPLDVTAVQQVQMELHYAMHDYFLAEDQILQNCGLIKHIPTIVIHGQNDLTCPLEAGWRLAAALPQSRFRVVLNAGHVAKGDDMIDVLVTATDEMAGMTALV